MKVYSYSLHTLTSMHVVPYINVKVNAQVLEGAEQADAIQTSPQIYSKHL